jgi:hypothetical protein
VATSIAQISHAQAAQAMKKMPAPAIIAGIAVTAASVPAVIPNIRPLRVKVQRI